jgi:hypothetical protein
MFGEGKPGATQELKGQVDDLFPPTGGSRREEEATCGL